MTELARDIRYAVRQIVREPSCALIIVLTIAVAIAANAAVFSMVDALVFRPFPLPDIDRLVMLWGTVPEQGADRAGVSPANFLDWKAQSESFDRLVSFDWWDVNLTAGDEPERVQGALVSPGFFPALGVRPMLGRTLLADENEPEPRTAVVSHKLWSRRFAADAAIVGNTILLNAERYDVVGVAPPGFDYPWGTEIWAPIQFDPETVANRDWDYLNVIGRLKDGATVEDAQAEMDLIAARLEREHPATNSGKGVRAQPLNSAVVDLGAPAFLAVWQATVFFVLLIACVNVASLLLARGADRQKELSLKLALGAGRFRLLRQLLTENVVLSFLGAALAMPLAWAGIDLLRSNLPVRIARFVMGWESIDLDWRVLGFTGVVAVLTALVFGLVPALQATRPDLTAALKEGGRGGSDGAERQRSRSALVVAEVAFTLMLLVAAGLSIRGTLRMLQDYQGYDPDQLMTMEITLPESKYEEESKRQQFYLDVLEGVRSLPEVVSADAVNTLPSSGSGSSRPIEVEGQPQAKPTERPSAGFRVITPGFFETMRIPLRAGRAFTEADHEDATPVAIISETMARRLWPDTDPVGKRFRSEQENPWLTIVGVVGDITQDWFFGETLPTFYRPLAQRPRYGLGLAIRTRGEPTSITPAVRAQVLKVDPHQPIFNVASMRQRLSDRMIGLKYMAVVMGIFGVIALVLSAVGIYGLIAYSVSRRTHEIGIRVALGAGHRDVLGLIIGKALRITVLGVAIGLLLAVGAGQLMAASLFGVVSLDPMTFVAFAVTLTAVSVLAGYVPARRALKVDPAMALRVE